MVRSFILITTLFLVAHCQSFAWGMRGHNIVAEIAFHYLNDTAQTRIMSYNICLTEAACKLLSQL